MICAQFDANGFLTQTTTPPSDLSTCSVLIFTGPEKASLDLLMLGGFDQQATELAFGGMLLLFVVGLGIGLIASQVRKLGKF